MFSKLSDILKTTILDDAKAKYSLPISCVIFGIGLGYLIKFGENYLNNKFAKKNDGPTETENALLQLLIEYMNGGWRPKQIQVGKQSPLTFFMSFYKPALVGASATVIIDNKNDRHKHLLFNIQRRQINGELCSVADFPCGFHQSDKPVNLNRHQMTFDVFNQLKNNLGRKPIQSEVREALSAINTINETPELSAPDATIIDTAKRETSEETGLDFTDPLIQSYSTQDDGTISFNFGSYFIHSIVFHIISNDLPPLKPHHEEGIIHSEFIVLNKENFSFITDDAGEIQGKVKFTGNYWLPIKPYDKSAQRLLYQLENLGLRFSTKSGGFPHADTTQNLDFKILTSEQVEGAINTQRHATKR